MMVSLPHGPLRGDRGLSSMKNAVDRSSTLGDSSSVRPRAATTTLNQLIGVGVLMLMVAVTSSPSGAQSISTLSLGPTILLSKPGTTARTATLIASTTAMSRAQLNYPKHPEWSWYITGGTALACILLCGFRRRWPLGLRWSDTEAFRIEAEQKCWSMWIRAISVLNIENWGTQLSRVSDQELGHPHQPKL